MSLAERVARRFLIAREMTWDKALEIMGFPPGERPKEDEVQRAYRKKLVENKGLHPDLGGDPEAMVELNVAKDVLQGLREPIGPSYQPSSKGYPPSSPGGGGGFTPEPFKETEVTFEEAKSKASIPNSKWLFVTSPMSSGYSTDSSAKMTSGWIAVGERDSTWDFVVVEHIEDASNYIGGGYRYRAYTIQTMSIPKKGPADARTLYGGVMKAWKLFDRLEKRFNSKILLVPDGWHFSNKLPKGNPTTIKNWLLDTGVMEESDLRTPRKYAIEVHLTKSRDDKPGFFKPKYDDWIKLTLIVNGREFDLTEEQTRNLYLLKVGGKRFLERVFGQYYYGGETKSLSKNRDGKKIMAWMVENLSGLPEPVVQALTSASK